NPTWRPAVASVARSGDLATAKLSQQSFHSKAFTAKLSQQSFHSKAFTAKLSQQSFHSKAFTAKLSAQRSERTSAGPSPIERPSAGGDAIASSSRSCRNRVVPSHPPGRWRGIRRCWIDLGRRHPNC